jgi:carbon-monoxide dehydrogenase iron sulfur subunit
MAAKAGGATAHATRKAVVVDLKKCLACRGCELACAQAHSGFDSLLEAILEDASLVPRVHVVAVEGGAVPVQCQHCEDAPCATVCPSGALYFDEADGTVHAVPAKCIGCKACVLVCPFGAAQWDAGTRKVVRCDLCADLIEEGEVPRCVAACPTHARRVVDLDEVAGERRKAAARRAILVMRGEPDEPKPEG